MIDRSLKHIDRSDFIVLGLIFLLAGLNFWNLTSVPFHPDESTQIFMSEDFSSLIQQPLDLAWDGDLPLTAEERYRAIDAPLTRYLIGFARMLFSTPVLTADWDWSASWAENLAAGALPTQTQLLVSRSAALLPLLIGFWLYFQALKKVLPAPLAILALILLGLNPLILLHGRRAMSEGILFFGIGFFLWSATREKRDPWTIGLALGIAFNAKHTALALIPAGLIAVSLIPDEGFSIKKAGASILKVLLVFGFLSTALNPFFWKKPLVAIQVGLHARGSLAAQQRIDHGEALGMENAGVFARGAAVLAQVYLVPPQTEEAGNYLDNTQESRQEYFRNPIHSWGRGWILGGLILILSLNGFILTWRDIKNSSREKRIRIWVWSLSSLGFFLILLIPLPWQRYIIPLLPFTAYWTAAGILPIWNLSQRKNHL